MVSFWYQKTYKFVSHILEIVYFWQTDNTNFSEDWFVKMGALLPISWKSVVFSPQKPWKSV